MTKFLAGVLSILAVGVLLIAYGLLFPRASALDSAMAASGFARPMFASEQVTPGALSSAQAFDNYPPARSAGRMPAYGYTPYGAPGPSVNEGRTVRSVSPAAAEERPVTTRYVERSTGRNWKKTALVIGGSSAAGAGLGA